MNNIQKSLGKNKILILPAYENNRYNMMLLKNKLSKEETSFIVKKIAICNDLWTQPQNVQLEAIQQLKKIQMQ